MSRSLPEIGRVVEVTRGRDAGLLCVVIGHVPDRFVIVADGDKRKVDKAKKKNVAHVRTTPYIALEVVEELREQGKVTNARLRHALRRYQEQIAEAGEAVKEGGQPGGEGRRD
ncbi:MAG: KOW domain-containing RNA-binding protein [Alicyclobacillus macrosporangiidus]|jgi:large subunit ribosomal protein L14e|uniref:Ribosomal protein L14E/L6E/L27E n=1 Tax=Alicyclobacillus macrosporangiidus TaxID=392015 RepID=A0A1I7I8C9_9BACL|nr:KOW domain-containing RNA-binding protein [Alicyclobacillus macrosporangiidus]SFU69104.1 hypothetical protein SAMN05421543_10657 [Alicyclobacillus macrosporangiidus]